MSWDFTADDLRKEIKEMKEKLAVQAVKIGEQESKLLKNEEELHTTKDNYGNVMYKLRKEADRSLELEEALKRRNDELRNERTTRENIEKALRTANEEKEKHASSAREAQHYLNQMATESNEYREQRERLAAEKTKLEAQVRELQAEIIRHEVSTPPPAKTPVRPRHSSLTNLNKVTTLERDIEQIRASASASETDLKSTQDRLSRAQTDLVRVENEKAALEKRLKDTEQKVKDVLEEKEEMQAELTFYRDNNASSSREQELIARVEEEESKTALLEQQLAQLSRNSTMKRSVDQLQARLNSEVSRREALEAREAQLVQEREEALNELDGLRMTLQSLGASLSQKDSRIQELEVQESMLREQLGTASSRTANSVEIAEDKISEMVNCIARIRAERDELKSHLEFVQMEAHFKVEALEKRLSVVTLNENQLQEYQSIVAQLREKLNVGRLHIQKLDTAILAMAVAVQHLHAQNNYLHDQIAATVSSRETALSRCGASSADAISPFQLDVSALQESLRLKDEELNHIASNRQIEISFKEETIAELQLRLSDFGGVVETERQSRARLETQVQELEVDLDTVKQKLADTLEHCERLEVGQSLEASADSTTRALKKEILELRNRIMRRTEQIGLQQHDIKRLETNMRLTDERLEEVLGELEMAETAKAAMLEDCSTAREERDQAKKSLMQVEVEVERLSFQVQDAEKETRELRAALSSMDERIQQAGAAKYAELAAMSNTVAERDVRISSLLNDLKTSEDALNKFQEQAVALRRELETAESESRRMKEKTQLKLQLQDDKLVASEEVEQRAHDLERLKQDVEALKLALTDKELALRTKNEENQRILNDIEQLTSELELAKPASPTPQQHDRMGEDAANVAYLPSHVEDAKNAHALSEALSSKEGELEQKRDELRQLFAELEITKASQEEAGRALELKEKELEATSAEVKRLESDLETRDEGQRKLSDILKTKEQQVAQMSEKIARLETEKAEIVTRLAVFESESEQGLNESSSLRSVLEEERKRHEEEINRLEAEVANLQAGREEQLQISKSTSEDLQIRLQETAALLETTKAELEEKQASYELLADEQRMAASSRDEEIADLKKQLDNLSAEVDALQQSLQEEVHSRKRDRADHEEELKAALDKQQTASSVESELRREIEQYQEQLAEVRENLMALQDENTTMQSEMDTLSGECHRANLKSQSLERQLASNDRELAELRGEMVRVGEALSRSEKSGKTAEMNLLLISQQHERTISSLRNQVKEHEKDAERIQKLQQIVGETKEQINEMEGLLRSKCAEIEENDDKFIQLLKEKKKLIGKVESLTKKNNNLQNKLASTTAGTSKVVSPSPQDPAHHSSPRVAVQMAPIFAAPVPVAASETPVFSTAKPRLSARTFPSQSDTPEQPRRISGTKRRREATPPLEEIPVRTSIGKKRSLPDDSDAHRTIVEARLPDSNRPAFSGSSTPPMPSSTTSQGSSMPPTSELMNTPRHRRSAQRTGFTPVRGQGALRPNLSQPSPVRKSAAAQALQASTVISDVTNSPPRSKRVFTVEPGSSEPRVQRPAGKGWLGKIRGGTNPLVRGRPQTNNEDNP